MKQIKEKKPSKLALRKQQLEKVWAEHPEAMVQLMGGILIFAGAAITGITKIATSDRGKETFYLTDGDSVYSITATKEKSIG